MHSAMTPRGEQNFENPHGDRKGQILFGRKGHHFNGFDIIVGEME